MAPTNQQPPVRLLLQREFPADGLHHRAEKSRQRHRLLGHGRFHDDGQPVAGKARDPPAGCAGGID
ncbi:MAG: hypothetical protein AAF202_02465, partial [Pseudomonadota bacterium]